MTAKEYLEQIKDINIRVMMLKDDIREIDAFLGVHGIRYDGVPSTINDTDKTTRMIIKLIEKKEEYNKEYQRLIDKREEIAKVVNQLEDATDKEIIYRRYFRFESIETISEAMNYSRALINLRHSQALEKIGKIIEK